MLDLVNLPKHCTAALAALIILQGVMLAALFTQTPPHPTLTIPLFALGPFLGAALAVGVAAIILGASTSNAGRGAAMLAAAMALISFGPQKWIDPSIGQIWPAILFGQIAVIVISATCISGWRSNNLSEGVQS